MYDNYYSQFETLIDNQEEIITSMETLNNNITTTGTAICSVIMVLCILSAIKLWDGIFDTFFGGK